MKTSRLSAIWILFAATAALGEPNVVVTSPLLSTGNGSSDQLRFDRNGRFAVFLSEAENLVPGQVSGGRRNVFLYDRIGGSVQMVSHLPGVPTTGGDGDTDITAPAQISADGNWVVFTSAATDLVVGQDDDNASPDVFLWSRNNDSIRLVSRQALTVGTAANGASSTQGPASTISDDGSFVLFASSATNLVAGQTSNAFRQVYQYDRATGKNALVSHASSSFLVSGADRSELATLADGRAVSADGRFAVFHSLATNLAAGVTDANANFDVFLWDRDAGLAASLVLLSRRAGNPLVAGNGASSHAVLSPDGRFAAFTSQASDLEGLSSDTNSALDVFRYDRAANLLELASHRSAGSTTAANGASRAPALGAGGDIAFESAATNLVVLQNDDNGSNDVFLWRGTQVFLVSHAADLPSRTGNGLSFLPVIGPDGGVGFTSEATDLVAGVTDTNGAKDGFYRPRTGTTLFLVSHVPDGTVTGDRDSTVTQLAFGGGLVAFQSQARNLVAAPLNGGTNLFLHGSLLMADGFESGDLTAWSQHFP